MSENLISTKHESFLLFLLKGDRQACSEFVKDCIDSGITIQELYEHIFKKSLYKVGELWEFNKISVASEHLASAIVEGLLNEHYVKIITKEKGNKTIVAASVENEFHQIGIKMISDTFEMHGWNSLFLGSNIPANELIAFLQLSKPDLLALSLSLYFNLPSLEKMIIKVQETFPELPVLVGGQAFTRGGQDVITKYKNVTFLPDINSTEMFIKQITP